MMDKPALKSRHDEIISELIKLAEVAKDIEDKKNTTMTPFDVKARS